MLHKKIYLFFDRLSHEKIQNQVAVAIFFILITLFSFGQTSYNDFFWHLALGKWMLSNHSFLTHDIFSLAFQGKLWLNNTWLFDGLVYLIHHYTGYIGLSFLRCIVFVSTYIVLFKTARLKEKGPFVFIVAVFLLTIPVIRNFLRPEITGPLFVASFLYILFKYKYYHSKLIFLLPVIEIMWVNTHGSFELGIILTGIFFGSELIRNVLKHRTNVLQAILAHRKIKMYAIIAVTVFLASFVNPYGYTIYPIVKQILADQESLKNIGEWQSFPWYNFFNFQLTDFFPLVILTWTAILTLLTQIISGLRQKRKFILFLESFSYEEVLLFIAFLVSALHYVRGVHMLALITALIVTKNGKLFWIPFQKSKELYVVIFTGALVIALLGILPRSALNTGPSEFTMPKEAFDFVLREKIPGNVLNEYAEGSDFIWYLYPQYKVFMDGRAANLFDASFYWYYRNLGEDKIFSKMVQDYNIQFMIGANTWEMSKKIADMENWTLVFFDNFASVYVKNDAAPELVEKKAYTVLTPLMDLKKLKDICTDQTKKAKLLEEVKRNTGELAHPLFSYQVIAQLAIDCHEDTASLQNAEILMKRAATIQPGNSVYFHNLGVIELKLDKNQEALDNFKTSLRLIKNKENMTGYAIALHNLGKYSAADRAFKKVISLPGEFQKEYYQVFGRVSYQLDHNAQAIDYFLRYLDLTDTDQITSQDYRDLANAYKDNNQPDKASEFFQKANDLEITRKKSL